MTRADTTRNTRNAAVAGARTGGAPAPPPPAGIGPAVAVGRAAAAEALAARRALAVNGLFHLVVTVALASLWVGAAQARGGSVVGYRGADLIWYIATTETVIMSVSTQQLIEGLGLDITSGRMEAELLRPVRPLTVRLAAALGSVAPRAVLCGTLGLGLALLWAGPPPRPAALALAAPSVVLAVGVSVMGAHAFAAACFWLRETRSAWFLYQKLVFLLGGLLLPLEALPTGLARVARFSPFAAQAYAPARLASGHLEPGWLAVQAAWLVTLGWLAHRLFRAGEARLVRTGGG